MPNLGLPEILLILVVVLLLFGPKKLPELAKGLGQSVREFKKGTQGLKDELEGSLKDEPASPTTTPVVVPRPPITVTPVHPDSAKEVSEKV